jgi:microcystin-dependent protein
MDPFLGEIRMCAFGFAPRGWAQTNGQLLSIAQNSALFSLLGATYGGNGQTTFGLPDLRGRVTIGQDGSHPLGGRAGQESVTVLSAQMPLHTHAVNANSGSGTAPSPSGAVWAADSEGNQQFAASGNTPLSPAAIAPSGGNQPHPNMMPYLTINFCVALVGVYPSRN